LAEGLIGIKDHLELFGGRARAVVIHGCLNDVRRAEPLATSYRVAEWVDAYLTYYAELVAAVEQTP
jgi:hypothetical protein